MMCSSSGAGIFFYKCRFQKVGIFHELASSGAGIYKCRF